MPLDGTKVSETAAVLLKARALIEDEANWCQGAYQKEDGRSCVAMALMETTKDRIWPTRAYSSLCSAMGQLPEIYNDTHTHSEVLAALDRAIRAELDGC